MTTPEVRNASSQTALITENPSIRTKGFKSENLQVIAATPDDRDVAERLEKRLNSGDGGSLGQAEKQIIQQIQTSYKRKLSGVAPAPEDLILNDFELSEFRHIRPEDTIRYLIYRYKYQKYPELKIHDDYPPCLQIEPTSICNFRCIMCYQIDRAFSRKSSGYMGHMSLATFKNIIDQVEGKVEAITLASRGEPLLNPQILEMIDYCRGKFLALKLNTNAALLDEEIIHGLLSSDIQTLVFSIDSADKEQYEKIRVNGKFDKLIENLEMFAKIRREHYSDSKLIVRISGVKINADQNIEGMSDQWGKYADIVAFTNFTPWQDSYNNPENIVTTPCTELWRRMFVWWDGVVNPCDFDYKSTMSRWNITDAGATISDIWTSQYYTELREKHLNHGRSSVEPCRRCVIN